MENVKYDIFFLMFHDIDSRNVWRPKTETKVLAYIRRYDCSYTLSKLFRIILPI